MFTLERVVRITFIAALVFIKHNTIITYVQLYIITRNESEDDKLAVYN